eukprot:TCALIF_10940-PA protein Name:"Protein of unknown function" AED:0.07 eAED:0.07 QI:0/0.5/0.33/1/0/0/3/425/410
MRRISVEQMSMEVPMLTQDEFFRHLELRSVHTISVKFHYRQALKERLRASTKQDTQNVTQKVALKVSRPKLLKACHRNGSTILSQGSSKWDSPNASRRFFMGGRGGTSQSQSSSNLGLPAREVGNAPGPPTNDPLTLLLHDPNVYPIPRVHSEIKQRLSGDREPEPRSGIVMRRNHLRTPENPSTTTLNQYTTRIRIQPPTQPSSSNILVVPPEFAQELANRGESSRNCSIFKNHSILQPLWSVNSLLSMVKSSKSDQNKNQSVEKSLPLSGFVPISPQPIRTPRPRPAPVFECEKCQLKFHAHTDLNFHEKSCRKFCRFCRVKLGLKRSQNTCRECLLRLKKRKIIPMILAQKKSLGSLPKCDICSKIFLKRTAMIKHVVAHHASEMHKVDLVKFVSDTRDHSTLACRS